MGRIIHVEITAGDVERATRFYAEAFGWRFETSPFAPGYHIADTGDGSGVNGAVMSAGFQSQPAIPWIEVDDLDATVEAVTRAGGSVAGDRQTIPGQGHLRYVRDPAGTLIGLRQPA